MRLATGERCVRFDEVDSTNAEARRRALAGEPGPLWILAARQSAGRGRRGRSWTSLPGNFMASLLLTTDLPAAWRPRLSFAAALAVHDALGGLLVEAGREPSDLKLKWPNDVLLDGRKLAGILLESEGSGLIVGIGVNLAAAPEGTDRPATALREACAIDVTPRDFLSRLSAAFLDRRGENFALTRAAWLERAMAPGSPLEVLTGSGRLVGRFAGLDEDGALLLGLADGRMERVSAGDVFPLVADS